MAERGVQAAGDRLPDQEDGDDGEGDRKQRHGYDLQACDDWINVAPQRRGRQMRLNLPAAGPWVDDQWMTTQVSQAP